MDDLNIEDVHVGHVETIDWSVQRESKWLEITVERVRIQFGFFFVRSKFAHVDEELEGHALDLAFWKQEVERVTVTFLVERYRVISSQYHERFQIVVVRYPEIVYDALVLHNVFTLLHCEVVNSRI